MKLYGDNIETLNERFLRLVDLKNKILMKKYSVIKKESCLLVKKCLYKKLNSNI